VITGKVMVEESHLQKPLSRELKGACNIDKLQYRFHRGEG
jgi:hypothetical protein